MTCVISTKFRYNNIREYVQTRRFRLGLILSKYILLVDDDKLLRRSLAFNLEQAGYRISSAANAEDALSLARLDQPDLVLLDIGLPGMDGLDALRNFKEQSGAPVIFLTARRRELDEVIGLELGADDYITKPFNIDVLLARIKVALRHPDETARASSQDERITAGDLVIDPGAHTVTLAGRSIELTPREFDLLHALAIRCNQVVSIDDLLVQVWGAEFEGEPQVVYVHIRWLRKKIEDDPGRPRRIVTVHGVGYKLETADA
jgi:DNA-binding response OmpR family regulator